MGYSDLLIEHTVLNRVMDIQNLANKDQEHLFAMIDAFLRDAKTRKAYS